jgi:hypothetical protein
MIRHAYTCPHFVCHHKVLNQEDFKSPCICGAAEAEQAIDEMQEYARYVLAAFKGAL